MFHKVQYGQTLWSIAIEYGTTIKNIQTLNNLGEDLVVYQGQSLLVQKAATQPAQPVPTSTPTIFVTSTMPVPPTSVPVTLTMPVIAAAPAVDAAAESVTEPSSRILVVILILAAFVGAGVAVWLIRDPD